MSNARNVVHRASEDHLVSTLHSLFAGRDILTRTRKATQIQSQSGKFLELDAWIPELNIGFEYQDPHHYVTTFYSFGTKEGWKSRDEEKLSILEERGDTLITVPCWWDGSAESLRASIHAKRKDLFPSDQVKSSPIPDEAPDGFFKVPQVPGIGEIMQAVFVATSTAISSTTWWIGEKYDGLRAFWVPANSSLYSSGGRDYQVQDPFKSRLPELFLDGEIWFGRGRYKDAAKFALIKPDSPPKWQYLRYVAFDCPDPDSHALPLESRFALLLDSIPSEHSFIHIAVNARCLGRKHVVRTVKAIMEGGGEGLMFREHKSPYIPGRSDSFMKIKSYRDQEALVLDVGYEKFVLLMPNGKEIDALLSQTYEGERPQKGDVVTYAITKSAKTKNPTQPQILRIRWELSWKEVLDNTLSYHPKEFVWNETARRALAEAKPHAHGHWQIDDHRNVRKFFDDLAQTHGFDPLHVEHWYRMSRRTVLNAKGGSSVLSLYNGSLVRALQDQYPNISIVPHKFLKSPQSYWYDQSNRRDFLNSFARKMNFDPLVPDNWYLYSFRHINNEKGGKSLINRYNGHYAKMLVDVYPDIGLKIEKFVSLPEGYWNDTAKRRLFFDSYAASKGFDPAKMENWSKIHLNTFRRSKSGVSILRFYDNSMAKALKDVYPGSVVHRQMFDKRPLKYWSYPANARKFFDDFALKNDFDPLVPEKWYAVSMRSILAEKSGTYVLGNYKGSLKKALMILYPNIGLSLDGFSRYPKSYWDYAVNRRELFEEYANKKGFDPLIASNWYNITTADIHNEKGGRSTLNRYGGSVSQALVDIFPNIGLDKFLFQNRPLHHWEQKENVRRFFDTIARTKKFNPNIPENWYKITKYNVLGFSGGGSILERYGASVAKALIDAYPDVLFDIKKFTT